MESLHRTSLGSQGPLGTDKITFFQTWARSSLNLFDLCWVFFFFSFSMSSFGDNGTQVKVGHQISNRIRSAQSWLIEAISESRKEGPCKTKSDASFTRRGKAVPERVGIQPARQQQFWGWSPGYMVPGLLISASLKASETGLLHNKISTQSQPYTLLVWLVGCQEISDHLSVPWPSI